MSKLVTPFGLESATSDVLRGVDLSGKTALVTGANSGIGLETARALASVGAAVVVAARRDRAGSDAAAQIAVSTGNPHVSHIPLDLADLESVARAAAGWSGPLHILVNNAGIMDVPGLARTCTVPSSSGTWTSGSVPTPRARPTPSRRPQRSCSRSRQPGAGRPTVSMPTPSIP